MSLLQEKEYPFGPEELDLTSYRPIPSHVTAKWIDKFLYRFNIVIRKQYGCLLHSTAQTNYIEKQVSYHLYRLIVLFTDGILDENYIVNVDETHFVFNTDNHHTLGVCGVDSVN